MKNHKKNFSISLNFFLLFGVMVPAYLQSIGFIPNTNIFITGAVYLFSIIICFMMHGLYKKIIFKFKKNK